MLEQDIGIQARTSKEGWAKMLEMKTGTSLEELCEGCPMPLCTTSSMCEASAMKKNWTMQSAY